MADAGTLITPGTEHGPGTSLNAGTVIGGFSNALSTRFDGINQSIDLGNLDTMDGATFATWAGWIYVTRKTATVDIICKRPGSARTNYRILHYDDGVGGGHLQFLMEEPNTVVPSWTGPANHILYNTWTHFAFVFNGSLGSGAPDNERLRAYVGGVDVTGTGTFSGAQWPSTVPTQTSINARLAAVTGGAANNYQGDLDEIAMWAGHAASAAQVAVLAGGPFDLSGYSGGLPTHWFRMGDGDAHPTVIDHGSAGVNGTMVNMSAGSFVANVP